MTTRLFLVRHGATELTSEDAFAGETDVALSDTGRSQAAKLAERLARETIAAFYASPLSRTMETARILAAPHRMTVTPEPGLREISHARWEGDPFSFAPEGGETGLAVTARALPALLTIVEKNPDAHVAVVSHKAT